MSYTSTISADAPLSWFHLDDSATSAVVDSGSAGGTATAYGTPSRISVQQGAAGYIGGYSMHWDNASGTYLGHALSFASSSDFSMEVWYRRDTVYASSVNNGVFLYHNGASKGAQLSIGSGGNILVNIAGSYVINAVPSGVTLMDGNWHHIAIVQSGSSIVAYIDGVSKATGTAPTTTNTSTTFEVGSIGTAQSCWLDEPAFYNKALSATAIANHYTAGTTAPAVNITVTPPYIDLGSLTEVAPSFAGGADVTVVAPTPSADSIYMPVPVVTASADITATPPAMTLSMAAPDASVSVTALVNITHAVTEDRNLATSDSTTLHRADTSIPIWCADPSGRNTWGAFKFAPITESIDAKVYWNFTTFFGAGGAPGHADIYAAVTAWSESGTTSPSSSGTVVSNVAINSGANSIDVTSLVKLAGFNGLLIRAHGTTSSSWDIYSKESATPSTLTVQQMVDNTTKAVTVTPPAATLSLTAPNAVVVGGYSDSVAVPAASLSIDVIAPGVSTTSDAINVVPAETLSLTFPGGIPVNPDYLALPGAMSIGISTPNAAGLIQYPITVAGASTYVGTLDMPAPIINLTTNRLSVAPVMSLSLKWPGIYIAAADRYMTKVTATTIDYDVWFKMDEASGTTVTDSDYSMTLINGVNTVQRQGVGNIVGAMQFQVDGPELRKAMRFNGVDTYIDMGNAYSAFYTSGGYLGGYWNVTPNQATTLEFSIRTTATDGVILACGAAGDPKVNTYGDQGLNAWGTDKGITLRLVGGQFVVTESGYSYKVRTVINDGNWHHVVLSSPGAGKQGTFVNVDGQREMTRQAVGASYGALLPRTVMAYMPPGGGTVTDYLAGDMRDLIVRPNTAIDNATAQQMYYEWSNATVVAAEPMTVSMTMNDPFSAKGNVKKMLAIYGRPTGWYSHPNAGSGFDAPLNTYYDPQGGLMIYHWNYVSGDISNSNGQGAVPTIIWDPLDSMNAVQTGGATNVGGYKYTKPVIYFDKASGYLVHPVWLFGNTEYSADGLINGEYEFRQGSGQMIDDQTGLPRFINLQEDLALDVNEFDVITVVNYPGEHISDDGAGAFFTSYYNETQYETARNAFRDSIMEAAYSGVSLWIPDWTMAQHCGFIEGVDVHDDGSYINYDPARGISMDSGENMNYAAEWLDRKHLVTIDTRQPLYPNLVSDPALLTDPATSAYYESGGQANVKFRIVSLEPGITDLPGWELGDTIYRVSFDDWNVQNAWYAYDLLDRSHGLQVGDLINTQVLGQGSFITSIRPQGIIGKVIAKEQQTYYGPYGVTVINPYGENAYIVATERGSVVRGRAIRGRAFIGLMDPHYGRSTIWETADSAKDWFDGHKATTGYVSTWSYDDRREHDVAITLITQKFKWDANAGTFSPIDVKTNYIAWGTVPMQSHPSISMNRRGLSWLAEEHTINADDATVYGAAMTVTLTTPSPTITHDRNIEIPVVGTMSLVVEVRDAKNFRGNDVQEWTLPINLTVEMRGIGAVVNAPVVATLTLTEPNAVALAHGDNIAVYLDSGNTISVFLKEDN